MTKTKRILYAALAVVLIGLAVFFAIYSAYGGKFDYDDADLDKYVTLAEGSYLGLALSADDTAYTKPGDDETLASIASKLLSYKTPVEGETTKYVEYKDTAIGQYDQVFLNYLGYYLDDSNNRVYFTNGTMMDLSKLQSFQVLSGKADAKLFADALVGKIPADSTYKLVEAAEDATAAYVPADKVIYIDYSWTRSTYTYTDETNTTKTTDEDGNPVVTKDTVTSASDTTLVTDDLRLDPAAVPAIFPAGFAAALVGKEIGTAQTLTFEDVDVEGVKYQYVYNVTVSRAVDEFTGFQVNYTYPNDSTEKDIYGTELKGKTVTFEVAVSYFYDVPTLMAEYNVDEDDTSEDAEKESIITHDDYLNFDSLTYYTEKEVLGETDWLAAEGNSEKTHADYLTYLSEQYSAYILSDLNDTYDANRKYAACDVLWKNILDNVVVTYPKKAVKVTYEELKDSYEMSYNEGSYTDDVTEATVYYRNEYSTFSKFMNNVYATEIEAGQTWKEALTDDAEEIVYDKLIIHYLYNKLGDNVKYTDEELEASFNSSYIYFYYYYGISLPTSAISEGLMFDKVMEYLYTKATVTWTSEAE